MSHPDRDEWIPYLFGEAAPEERRRLGDHLRRCPECEAEISSLSRTLKRLDLWKVPGRRSRLAGARPVLKRLAGAAAAAILLGAGIALGRLWSPPPPIGEALRSEIETCVRQAVGGETGELRRGLEVDRQRALDALRREFKDTVAQEVDVMALRAVDAAVRETRELLAEVARALSDVQARDAASMQAAIREIRQQQAAAYLSLRADLETVASLTEDAILRTSTDLVHLATLVPQVREGSPE